MEEIRDNSYIYTSKVRDKACRYVVLLSIYARPEYTAKGLCDRIKGRMSYHNGDDWDAVVEHIEVKYRGERRPFHAKVVVYSDDFDKKKFKEQLYLRFGRTSTKPWVSCRVHAVH